MKQSLKLPKKTINYYLSGVILLLSVLLIPLGVSAQNSSNQAPVITSEPILSITTDQIYEYQVSSQDLDGDEILYHLITSPSDMSLTDNAISWQPTATGTFNVVLEISDQKAGYDTQAWQITVEPGAVEKILIIPNDRPNIVNIGNNQQFTASVYDQYNNPISTATITWSTDENIGSINEQGLFLANKGGLGFVAAQAGDIKASVGVVVKDIRSTLISEKIAEADDESADVPEDTSSSSEETSVTPTTLSDQVLSEETTTDENSQENNNIEVMEVIETTEKENEEAGASSKDCTNWPQWLIIFIIIAYGVIMIVYFQYEKKHKSASWWIFPVLLTIISLTIYFKYICTGTYIWWPWVLVGTGMILTLIYKAKLKKDYSNPDQSQTELPF